MRLTVATFAALLWTLLPNDTGAFSARAQPVVLDTVRVTLETYLELARDRNPQLLLESLRHEAAELQAPQVQALPEPTIGVTVAPFPIYTARGTQRSQWRLEQAIPYPGKRSLQGEIAELDADIVALEAAATERDVVLRVKQAYYDVVRLREQRREVERFREDLTRFEEIAAARYEVGEGSQQAILKAQLERAQLDVRLEKLRQGEHTMVEQLAGLLDLPSSEIMDDSLMLGPEPPLTLDAAELIRAAQSGRPERAALESAVDRSEMRIALAKKAALPDFMVAATYFDVADADAPMSADGRDALAISAGIKLPLWRGKIRAGIEQAEVERRRMRARIEAFDATVRPYVQDLVHRIARQTEQLRLLEQTLVPQAQSTREATLSAYTTGRATFLDLLDVERTLFMLHMDRIETDLSRYQTLAMLEFATGIEEMETQNQ